MISVQDDFLGTWSYRKVWVERFIFSFPEMPTKIFLLLSKPRPSMDWRTSRRQRRRCLNVVPTQSLRRRRRQRCLRWRKSCASTEVKKCCQILVWCKKLPKKFGKITVKHELKALSGKKAQMIKATFTGFKFSSRSYLSLTYVCRSSLHHWYTIVVQITALLASLGCSWKWMSDTF